MMNEAKHCKLARSVKLLAIMKDSCSLGLFCLGSVHFYLREHRCITVNLWNLIIFYVDANQ